MHYSTESFDGKPPGTNYRFSAMDWAGADSFQHAIPLMFSTRFLNRIPYKIPQLTLVEGKVNYKFIKIERRNCIVDSERDMPRAYIIFIQVKGSSKLGSCLKH